MGKKLSFPYADIQSDVPKGKFILKNNTLESQSCFRLTDAKINYAYNLQILLKVSIKNSFIKQ